MLLIVLFAALLYAEILSYRSFGPEYAIFYLINSGRTLQGVLEAYSKLADIWYRPTGFVLPYYLGHKFLDWHDILGWKILNLSTAILASFCIYWLVRLLFPGRRLAAFLAGLYFIGSPNLFNVVFEFSAFDFMHVIFSCLCVIFFLKSLRRRGATAVVLTALSLFAFAWALTSKEISFITPVYLIFVCFLLMLTEGNWRRWRRFSMQIAPFVVLMALYWTFHVQQIPKGRLSKDGDYREETNWALIQRNAIKDPLEIARIYGVPRTVVSHADAYANPRNNLIGIAAALIVCAVWIRLAATGKLLRQRFILLLGWIVIFSLIPIYSGGYLWHTNLAMAGYAALFGFAFAFLFEKIKRVNLRLAAVAVFVAGFLLLARANAWEFLRLSPFRYHYRLNYTALDHPPVPFKELHNGEALVYIEDRMAIGSWGYGGGNKLFKLIYLNPEIKEAVAPPMFQTPPQLCSEWLANPGSYYFAYDEYFHWMDKTRDFKAYCAASQ